MCGVNSSAIGQGDSDWIYVHLDVDRMGAIDKEMARGAGVAQSTVVHEGGGGFVCRMRACAANWCVSSSNL